MIVHNLFEYFVNSLWQLPVLVLATWLLIRFARPGLALQHALWLAALFLAVLIPARGIDWSPGAAVAAPILDHGPAPFVALALPAPIPQPTPSVQDRMSRLAEVRIHPLRLSDRTVDWLLELYAVSVAFSLARLVHGYLAARRLAASAVEHPLTTLESTLLAVCAHRLGLPAGRFPSLRFLDDPSATPMVIGIRHPVLLLPTSMRHTNGRDFNDLDLTAILSHELAHVRRRDYLANFLARIVSLPIAYHPVSRVLHARIRQTREMICDSSAAGAFDSASSYARSLLAIADRIVQTPANLEAVGLFDHARNTLEERIMNLTAERLPTRLSLRAVRIAAGTAILLAAAGTAATVHVKPTTHLIGAVVPVVFAAQTPQAPTPAADPAPAPDPKPHPHARAIINGEVRDLTPEEREQLDRDLADSREQIRKATEQLNDPAFKIQIANSVNLVNSVEFKKQMEDMKIQLKQFDSPEFKQQIIDAQKLSNLPDLKLDLSQLKVQLESPEFRQQVEETKDLALQVGAEAGKRAAETRKNLDEAAAAIAGARRQVNDANVQQQLDHAQKSIQDATRNIR